MTLEECAQLIQQEYTTPNLTGITTTFHATSTMAPIIISFTELHQHPHIVTTRRADLPNPHVSHTSNNMGRLPALFFGLYTLGQDFLAFLRDFNTVAEAYLGLESYCLSQFQTYLRTDAKDLFESCTDADTLRSWILV